MKVVAFNGSPRKNGNTSLLIERVFAPLREAGIETELVQVGGQNLHGCRACYQCFERKDGHCVFDDDILNECVDKMREADGIILGSPTYFANMTAEMKALIDRAGLVSLAAGGALKRKVGAAVVAVRRAGALPTFDGINHFFHLQQMIVPGASYWNLGIGREIGQVESDEEGLRNMQVLGENIAWLLEKLHG
ncbi:MAG: flavodoxin family protein [Armatimonadetes bacterium]|nr:flavodoxin family protein [Armatimonadota bacterium]